MTVPERKEQNAGVALLLERMKTHPEEFTEQGKWVSIMQDVHKYAEPEESKALNDALKALMMQKVTERVLEGLVDPKPLSGSDTWVDRVMAQKGITSAGQTPARSSVTINNTNAVSTDLHELLQMKAQLELERQKTLTEKHKAIQVQKTLFGKLKNYLHNEPN